MRVVRFPKQKVDELRHWFTPNLDPPAKLVITRISNQEDFQRHLAKIAAEDPDRKKRESGTWPSRLKIFARLGFVSFVSVGPNSSARGITPTRLRAIDM